MRSIKMILKQVINVYLFYVTDSALLMDRSFREIARMTNLKTLRLIGCCVMGLKSLGLPSSLESFEAVRCMGFTNAAILDLVKVSPALHYLDVLPCDDLDELAVQINKVIMSGQRKTPLTIPVESGSRNFLEDQGFSPLLRFCDYPDFKSYEASLSRL